MDYRELNMSSPKDRLDLQPDEHYQLAVDSMRFIISEFFMRAAASFVITISCRYQYTFNYYRNLAEDLFGSMDSMIVQLVLIEKGSPRHVPGLRQHNLLLVDSLEAFLDIDPIQYTSDYNSNEFYYVFLQQRDEVLPEETRAVLDYCWRHQLINCNVQIQTAEGRFFVYTYYPYRADDCRSAEPVLLHEFHGAADAKWVIFPNKLRNMHGCSLRVASGDNPPFIMRTGAERYDGFEGSLLTQLARQLNFSIRMVNPQLRIGQGRKEPTKGDLIEGSLRLLQEHAVDLAIGNIRKNSTRNRMASSLFSHLQMQQVFVVLSDAQNYTSLEVFVFPYQSTTWMGIMASVLVAFICSSLVHQRGTGFTWIDFVATTMGIGREFRPQASHERLLNINWSLGSFIMRSCYAALLYHLFCHNLHRKPPQTFWDLLSNNYSLVLTRDTMASHQDLAVGDGRGIRVMPIDSANETSSFEWLDQSNGVPPLAAVGNREVLLFYAGQRRKAGRFQILKKALMNQQLTIYLAKHSHLIDQLNDCLLWIQSAGLMNYWVRASTDNGLFANSKGEVGVRLFSNRELRAIYLVCGGMLGVAFVVFLIELLVASRRRRNPLH